VQPLRWLQVRDGEKLRSELRDDMKKLAKSAAAAATKVLPTIEQRLVGCEARGDALEQVSLLRWASPSLFTGLVLARIRPAHTMKSHRSERCLN
jgi:hypothetical protein